MHLSKRNATSPADRLIVTARQRSEHLLAATDWFEPLGLGELSSEGRSLARLTLELCDRLEAEESARRSLQDARDKLQEIVGEHAHWACLDEEYQ